MRISPLHATDFYKVGHIRQYPAGTTLVYSNFTCRSDRLAAMPPDFDHRVVFFGLQGLAQWLLIDAWNEEFFHKPRAEVVDAYRRRMDLCLGEGAVDVAHIEALHDLGHLPLRIKALPEGSRVDMRVPLLTVVNTHPDFFWVTNYVETQLSAELWKAITSATIAHEYRRLFARYAERTGADPAMLPWLGHDFSARGMSGIADGAASGAGHLLSFRGTDTIAAIDYLEAAYPDGEPALIGGSVPATEHSVMCMGGEDDELGTFRRLVTETYPSGIVSIVSDTWDFWRVVTEYAAALAPEILARTPDALGRAKVVFRPDSGDPVAIIAGDPEAAPGSPERKGAVECLWDVFGGTTTDRGYRVLHPRVGLIYGDSITLERAARILEALAAKGFASGNMVFGIGSYTYQHVTRDSFGTAIKSTFGVVGGEDRVLFKAPKTDNGTKTSARGLLRVEEEDGRFVLHEMQTREQEAQGLLRTVFEDGRMVRMEGLRTLRHRLWPPVAAR
ncbi:MAG: nicotinate phosphoribosyltransferase [Janthinobacterium lividum]